MRLLLLTAALLALTPRLFAQISPDGTINAAEGYTLLGTSDPGVGPGFGASHEINALYASVDPAASTLSLGIAGNVQDGNRILVFIDSRQGGYTDGSFGRAGAPNGLNNFNSGTTFDPGFSADYALVSGRPGATTTNFSTSTPCRRPAGRATTSAT